MRSQASRTLAGVLCIALVVAAAAMLVRWAARAPPSHAPLPSALTRLPAPRALHAFALRDHEGRDFGLARLHGAWTLLSFGFTSCPDICPTTLVDLARVRRELAARGEPEDATRLVFVSVDPRRDDPATLARYVRHFDPALVGASGEPEALKGLAAQLGAAFEVLDDGTQDYPVRHTTAVFVVDPRARLCAILRFPLDPPGAAAALLALRRASDDG